MESFHHYTPLTTVKDWLQANRPTPQPLQCELPQALQRPLATPIHAEHDLPSQNYAAIDGYALQGQATLGASDYNPLLFQLSTAKHLAPQQTSIVSAGEALPTGCDAILPAAYGEMNGQQLVVTQAIAPSSNVLRQAQDCQADTLLFSQGHVLRPQDANLLQQFQQQQVTIYEPPLVNLLIVGDEWVEATAAESNRLMLESFIERDGGVCSSSYRGDVVNDVAQALRDSQAAITLLVGSSGKGENDVAAEAIKTVGELAYHGVALRPAESCGMGLLGEKLMLMLPGHPVQCLAAYDVLVSPVIRSASGYADALAYQQQELPLTKKLVSKIGYVDYCRVKITPEGVSPLGCSSLNYYSSVACADGFVVVPESLEGYAAGSLVRAYRY